jgi:hypothetical protein
LWVGFVYLTLINFKTEYSLQFVGQNWMVCFDLWCGAKVRNLFWDFQGFGSERKRSFRSLELLEVSWRFERLEGLWGKLIADLWLLCRRLSFPSNKKSFSLFLGIWFWRENCVPKEWRKKQTYNMLQVEVKVLDNKLFEKVKK